MKKLPAVLVASFLKTLAAASIDRTLAGDYLKWLRFYLDFCLKYRHPPRDSDSLQPFLQKLAEKNQPVVNQEQAAQSVKLYYETLKNWPNDSAVAMPSDAWAPVFKQLKDEIRLRQYSPKTLKTYRVWIEQFKEYLVDKPPSAVSSEEARRFLTHLVTDRNVVASTQNQAFNALLFLYRHILKADYDLKDKVVRARRTRYIPVVLTREMRGRPCV